MPTYDGMRALVTGGGSGIGAATARLLRDGGAQVACVDLDPAGAPEGCQTERPAGSNPRREEITTSSPHVRALTDDHAAVSLPVSFAPVRRHPACPSTLRRLLVSTGPSPHR